MSDVVLGSRSPRDRSNFRSAYVEPISAQMNQRRLQQLHKRERGGFGGEDASSEDVKSGTRGKGWKRGGGDVRASRTGSVASGRIRGEESDIEKGALHVSADLVANQEAVGHQETGSRVQNQQDGDSAFRFGA